MRKRYMGHPFQPCLVLFNTLLTFVVPIISSSLSLCVCSLSVSISLTSFEYATPAGVCVCVCACVGAKLLLL